MGAVALATALFVFNGLVVAHRNDVVLIDGVGLERPAPRPGDTLVVMAYNVAKCFVHEGGLRFQSLEAADSRVSRIEAAIRDARPDIVMLSEVLWECAPCPIDQVARIARAAGLRYRALGENYNIGIPGFRIAGGNAILSRFPIRAVANFDLPGRRPFWISSNNRRALFAALSLGDGGSILLGAMHLDSFSRSNNTVQMREVLAWIAGRPALLAGDFNSRPHEPGMQLLRASNSFAGEFDGPGTLMAVDPPDRLDYVLAPSAWEHLSTHIQEVDASDHLPVVATFRIR